MNLIDKSQFMKGHTFCGWLCKKYICAVGRRGVLSVTENDITTAPPPMDRQIGVIAVPQTSFAGGDKPAIRRTFLI